MGEGGLSPREVGEAISEHAEHAHGKPGTRHDRAITFIEATMLAIVAVLVAYSGFASAEWATESRLLLARSVNARTDAGRDELTAMQLRNFDASTFNTWAFAYLLDKQKASELAINRFRPGNNLRASTRPKLQGSVVSFSIIAGVVRSGLRSETPFTKLRHADAR